MIGINTEKAGLENLEQLIIPAQKGELRYLKTPPIGVNKSNVAHLMAVGDSSIVNWGENENLLKHALLYKMSEWAYEEEVRVVKNISMKKVGYHDSSKNAFTVDGQSWNGIQLLARPIYTIRIPEDAFVEVIIGLSCYADLRRKQEAEELKYNPEVVAKFQQLKKIAGSLKMSIFKVERDFKNWGLEKKLME